jgi:hypothetical protein
VVKALCLGNPRGNLRRPQWGTFTLELDLVLRDYIDFARHRNRAGSNPAALKLIFCLLSC